MPKLKWYHYLSVGSFVAGWMSRVFVDGVITKAEAEELVRGIFEMLGVEGIEIK